MSRSLVIRRLIALAFAGLLAACGGGGSESSSVSSGGSSTPPANGGTSGAPTIQGKGAGTVLANQGYTFQPSATDPNGDALTFSATNLPDWATINPATGQISGTPTSADVGTYGGIVISVSDGHSTASLPAFSITVTQTAAGSATLSWLPPTQNTDGSTLTDLAGFQVLYGQSPSDLSESVKLTNPSLNSYVVENLTPGTWYFTVVALNSAGVTSPLSNLASKTIS
ncbi:MAG TPA: putative Ig domain-containing protein [Steroidobacteraceae bacterium]|nr:putative Ig domain-containing protein [Steroidobacteraceae bacterium]